MIRLIDQPQDLVELAPPQRENAAIIALEESRKKLAREILGNKQVLARAEHDAARAKANIQWMSDEISDIDSAMARLKAARDEQGD